jgi:hypothetical protein
MFSAQGNKDLKVEDDVPFRPVTPVGNAKQNVMAVDIRALSAMPNV